MQLHTVITIASSLIGFSASVFFISGVLRVKAIDITNMAGTKWNSNQHIENSLVNQKADYTAGAGLLGLAFLCELSSKLITVYFPNTATTTIDYGIGYSIVSFLIIMVCAFDIKDNIVKKIRIDIALINDKNNE